MADLVDLVHRSSTPVPEASTNDVALPPFLPHQRTARRNASVVREKNASGRERIETGESGTIGAHRPTRVMWSASVTATPKQNRTHRRTVILVTRDHNRRAHIVNSLAMKTSGWRNLHLRDHLSLPYPIPQPLKPFRRPLHLGPPRRRPMTVTRLTRKWARCRPLRQQHRRKSMNAPMAELF